MADSPARGRRRAVRRKLTGLGAGMAVGGYFVLVAYVSGESLLVGAAIAVVASLAGLGVASVGGRPEPDEPAAGPETEPETADTQQGGQHL